MGTHERYELVFEQADRPASPERDVVVVHRTERSGPGGHPVYADETGIVQAEISDRGEVRMVASGGHQSHAAPVRAEPVDD
ncbi:hypothetical protein IHE55_27305 [Streptomyces pactum]|uniref:DUF1918 domain-containing protein n=1 Tax=Streptomyces pactum TaxID=68249 RepID=A0ABS0NSV7_9ACTN|nr:DUF6296 family protein [Streptomyces pactum]MBH5338293.1 hypothetical protein [Streptomyces pactum]